MQLWRISKARFANKSFSGEGTRLFGGRWNFAGVSMIYTSPSLALAAIEFFVHLDPSDAPEDLVSISAALPDELPTEQVDVHQLPAHWRRIDNENLQKFGSDWASSMRTAALIVPSAAIDGEWNVLLNPVHADFSKIKIASLKPFHYDERMFKYR